jgi:hypothetical protein
MEIKIVGLIGVLHKRYGAYIQNQSLVHTNNRQHTTYIHGVSVCVAHESDNAFGC